MQLFCDQVVRVKQLTPEICSGLNRSPGMGNMGFSGEPNKIADTNSMLHHVPQ